MGLLDRIVQAAGVRGTWPPPGQRPIWEQIELWEALRTSHETRLKQQAGVPWHRRYLISPVPRMISRASANLLYGEAPEPRAANEADQPNLERIVSENGYLAEAHRAAMIASSEAEVWGRILVDPSLLDVPIIEFVSRRRVIPHFRGRFVVGATFLSEFAEGNYTVYRLLETYEPGAVRAEVYLGTHRSLGSQIPLDSFGPTEGRQDVVYTGIPYPLVAFIPNSIDADPCRGYGDYQGCEERFLAINEAATVGQENLRLAGKKRALLDAKYLRNGRLPAGDDIFVRHENEVTAGEGGKPLQLLEYAFESDALITWLDNTIDTTLSFAGTAPELVGRRKDGGQISGTALKLRMIHSLMEASGKGSYMDRGHRRLLKAAAIIDSRPTTQGGFGRRWREPDADHELVRGDGLPRDDMEAAQWLVLAAGADAISIEEKVRWLHPEWPQDKVDDEVDRIRSSQTAPLEIPVRRTPPGAPAPPEPEPAGAGAA